MIKKLMFVGIMITLILGCTIKKVDKLESAKASKEFIKVDLTGMTKEQQEVTKGMIDDVIILIKS